MPHYCFDIKDGHRLLDLRAAQPDLQALANPIYRFKRIGLEAGPLSQFVSVGARTLACSSMRSFKTVCRFIGSVVSDKTFR